VLWLCGSDSGNALLLHHDAKQSHGPGIAVSLKVIRDTAQKPVPINFGVLCAVAVHLLL